MGTTGLSLYGLAQPTQPSGTLVGRASESYSLEKWLNGPMREDPWNGFLIGYVGKIE
jgi:hypothetical protein